jgi:hypothetical protein
MEAELGLAIGSVETVGVKQSSSGTVISTGIP